MLFAVVVATEAEVEVGLRRASVASLIFARRARAAAWES